MSDERLGQADCDRDRRAIEAVLVDYCWANDAGDADAVAETFHLDATYQSMGDLVRGRRAIRSLFEQRIKARADQPITDPQHWMSNVRVVLDGDLARVQSYYQRVARAAPGPGIVIIAMGFYDDELTKVEGRWLIQRRTACATIPVAQGDAPS